jgi:hypothetical protein
MWFIVPQRKRSYSTQIRQGQRDEMQIYVPVMALSNLYDQFFLCEAPLLAALNEAAKDRM